MNAIHPNLEYREDIFEGWLIVFIVRCMLVFINMAAITITIGLLPKLIINLNSRAADERREMKGKMMMRKDEKKVK